MRHSSASTRRGIASSVVVLITILSAWFTVMGGSSVCGTEYQWQEVWGDEFDYNGAPDPTKWGYEIGQLRNGEAQYYTSRPDNVRVANGTLIIEAQKESYNGAQYTSASIQTLSTDRQTVNFSTIGGRLEVRAKLPSVGGTWPAFWTMGTDSWTPQGGWPKSGEIDVFEYIANTPYVVFGNLHYAGSDGLPKDNVGSYDPRSTNLSADPLYADWHTFRVDWYPDRIEWYMDDILYHMVTIDPSQMTDNPFNKPQYLILNLAVGGSWGSPIDADFNSAELLVDYVRVSQLMAIPEPPVTALFWLGLASTALLVGLSAKSRAHSRLHG
ncbi:MAG: glycoside hydrolase family 16 protein [Verrucomicrobiales bacterium]|jgi:beta-glucanase (GH16 family)|nr:glycoside hydrolase family 16 protein [Verrucomicrobiales bacterium]